MMAENIFDFSTGFQYELSARYLALALIATAFIFYTVWIWYRLRHIPGPFLISLSKLWQIKTQVQGRWYLKLRDMGDRYGDVFRAGPNQVFTTDVDIVYRMAHHKSSYRRSKWYSTFRTIPTEDHCFCITDERAHTERRNKVSSGYGSNQCVEECIDRQVVRLIDLIGRKFLSTATKYRPLDLSAITMWFTMDCVGDMSYGKPFGCLDEGEDVHRFQEWNDAYFPITTTVSNLPFLINILFKWPFNKIYPSEKDPNGVGKYLGLATEAVHRRFAQNDEQRRDVLSAFIAKGVTKSEAINEMMLQVVAGTDSTAVGIRMTLLHLVATPHAYAKLRAEIDEAAERGELSYPVKDSEARKLPYLQAAIKEGLRVFPVVTAPFFKIVPKGGDFIAGHFVPAGTEVGLNISGIMRTKKYWGEDADVFRPERWLEADAGQHARMSEVVETLFGAGRYKCLGRNIAQMELNKALVELMRNYDFTFVGPEKGLSILNPGFFVMSGLHMRVTKREQAR